MESDSSGYRRTRSGTPPTWSQCQCVRSTCESWKEDFDSTELIKAANAGTPWPVSMMSLSAPVPTIYVLVPCSVSYMFGIKNRYHVLAYANQRMYSGFEVERARLARWHTLLGFWPRTRITRGLICSISAIRGSLVSWLSR